MALWRVRTESGIREGLTLYQVQELIRSGQLRGENEVADGDGWSQLRDVPGLARFLPATSTTPMEPKKDAILVHGLLLRLDKDGKPVPPTQEEMMRLLAAEAAETRLDREKSRRVLLLGALVVAGTLLALIAVYFLRARMGQ